MLRSDLKFPNIPQKESGNQRLLWSFGMALGGLGIGALLLLSAYILLSPALESYRSDHKQHTSSTLAIPGSDLSARMGTATENPDKSLTLSRLAGDRAILTRHLTLQAQDYDFLQYQLSNRNPSQTIYLIWRTAAKPAEVFNVRLGWSGDDMTTIRLAENPNWQGTITEIGLDIYGDLRGEPLVISDLHLLPGGVTELLSAIWSDWTAFTGWTQKSINFQGNPGAILPTPTEAAAAWAGLTLALLLLTRSPIRGQPRVIIGVALLVTWFALDMLWQRELNIQFDETRYLFDGKTMDERHLVDQDSAIYRYAKRLKEEVLPAAPSRVFILHDSAGHNYERLKTQYYLLPHNIYNYGQYPLVNAIRPGDFILMLGDIPGLSYQHALGLLAWGESSTLKVSPLDSDKKGQLFRVTKKASSDSARKGPE